MINEVFDRVIKVWADCTSSSESNQWETNMCSETPEGREFLEKPCNTPKELEDLCTMLKDPDYKKRAVSISWLLRVCTWNTVS